MRDAHQPFLPSKSKIMTINAPVIPNWLLQMPDYVIHQYELMFAHPDAINIAQLTKLKAECLYREYYTYLAQLKKLEREYGIDLPVPPEYRRP